MTADTLPPADTPSPAVTSSPAIIGPPADAADLAAARALILDYAGSLGFSLCFQNFDAEMAAFPGVYVPPSGALLLARHGGRPVGVVALRDLGDGACEMKRLHLDAAAPGLGLGRRLVEAIVAEARRLGYARMRLDTMPGPHDRAIALYRALGFRDIAPYGGPGIDGLVYLELDLAQPAR